MAWDAVLDELAARAGLARRPAVRIVCVGNSLVPGDDLGPRVHAALRSRELPEGVELIDGGLGGLGLLRELEGAREVVFVDALAGFDASGPLLLQASQALGSAAPAHGHAEGLTYLLHVLEERPEVFAGRAPRWVLVGAEGPADGAAVRATASLALSWARHARERAAGRA